MKDHHLGKPIHWLGLHTADKPHSRGQFARGHGGCQLSSDIEDTWAALALGEVGGAGVNI